MNIVDRKGTRTMTDKIKLSLLLKHIRVSFIVNTHEWFMEGKPDYITLEFFREKDHIIYTLYVSYIKVGESVISRGLGVIAEEKAKIIFNLTDNDIIYTTLTDEIGYIRKEIEYDGI
jgi:hypothetical protein